MVKSILKLPPCQEGRGRCRCLGVGVALVPVDSHGDNGHDDPRSFDPGGLLDTLAVAGHSGVAQVAQAAHGAGA